MEVGNSSPTQFHAADSICVIQVNKSNAGLTVKARLVLQRSQAVAVKSEINNSSNYNYKVQTQLSGLRKRMVEKSDWIRL